MSAPLWVQRLLPKRALSTLLGGFADLPANGLSQLAIRQFMRAYGVDLAEAERSHASEYRSFNDFFTRRLKPGVRPLSGGADTLVSPCDGTFGECGRIERRMLLQAKGHRYPLADLLADSAYAAAFDEGHFFTVYLAPRDYHRVHMPLDGKLIRADYVRGTLFSVNPSTESEMPGLFARNERLVCRFDTIHGPLALVMVGALIVNGIRTSWGDPRAGGIGQAYAASRTPRPVARGDELGYFRLGSTVILCCPPNAFARYHAERGTAVRMGAMLGASE